MYRTRLASTGRPNRARSRPPLTLERRTSMATEYVDAGTAIPYQSLSAYDGQRYSPLDQINASNVKQLTPAWVYQVGSMGLHSGASTYAWEASPIVVDGIMYVSAWDGQLFALDAAKGNELWRYKHASPFD